MKKLAKSEHKRAKLKAEGCDKSSRENDTQSQGEIKNSEEKEKIGKLN